MKQSDLPMNVPFRWQAIVQYRTDNGPIDVPHGLHELDELRELIEKGPDFGAIAKIEIKYLLGDDDLTIEQAERL
jgi:hypothetical protein